MFSIAVVQTKPISCNSANKSCLLQLVHTKAIAASTQFCDFYIVVSFALSLSLNETIESEEKMAVSPFLRMRAQDKSDLGA